MNILSAAFFIFLAGITAGCISGKREGPPPLEVFPFVDVTRYAGDWYEIARYPNSFQEGCGKQATYTMERRKDRRPQSVL
jgi:apolipoprotein D and lipocalin family protein